MSACRIRVDLQGCFRCFPSALPAGGGIHKSPSGHAGQVFGQRDRCIHQDRIELQSTSKIGQRCFEALPVKALRKVQAAEVIVIRLAVARNAGCRDECHLELQFTSRGGRNFLLYPQEVGDIAIEGSRPTLCAVAGVDQLSDDADLIARTAHAAFDNVCAPSAAPIFWTSGVRSRN